MSIYAIRNQPFQFGNNLYPRSLALMCCADDPVPSLIAATDEVWAQATLTQCGSEDGIVISGGPDGWDGWVAGDGFFLSGTSYALAAPTPGTSLYMPENAVAGTQYTIQLEVANVTGTAYVIFGGVQSPNLSDGLNEFLITANSASPFELIVDSGTITVNSVVVTALNTDVSAIFHQGSTELVFDQSDYPDNFYFFNGGFTFHMPMSTVGIAEGCFTLELRDNCSDTGMTSQVFRIVDANCETFLIRACNDYDNIGFVVPFVPRIRIPASMGWPSYNTDVQEERHSDGEIFRPYGDRTRTMTVKTGILNEFDHAFLSTLPLYDHVYIGSGDQAQEVVVSKGKYEPLYGEDQNLNGAVVFDVSPKAELVRKVQCGPALDGCAPESDPQCIGGPQYAWAFVPVDGGFDFQLTILSASNFTPSTASITVADGAPVTQTVGTLPSTLTWGPFAAETPITLRIFDTMNQNCVITKFFDVPEEPEPFVCDEPGTINIVTTTDIVIRLESSTGYYTAKKSGGALTVYPISTYLTTSAGEYCVWSSDDAGVISGTGTVFYAGGDGLGVTTANFNNVPGIEAISLDYTEIASIDFSANVTTKHIALEYITVLSSVDLTNNIGLESFSINYNPDLQEILVSSLPVCAVANAYNCALTQTCVDSLLVAFAASGLAVNVDLTGGTNAAPSPTGLAAKATIEGNGGTVFVNP